ncbi:hypothetical protein SOVF_177590 [Spinacia oleracea]|nr:hypothetical protein SOVF_177590 [Spinacia oleracea]
MSEHNSEFIVWVNLETADLCNSVRRFTKLSTPLTVTLNSAPIDVIGYQKQHRMGGGLMAAPPWVVMVVAYRH